MQESYGFHLFFIDFVKNVEGGSVPEGFHWYNLGAIDGTLPANDDSVYGFVKLPAMAFFAGIMPRRPSKFKNTRILESGVIRAANQVVSNPVFGEFYVDRATQAWKLTKDISTKQQDKIIESIKSNSVKSLNSFSFQIFLAEQYWKTRQEAGYR